MPKRYGRVITPVFRDVASGLDHEGTAVLVRDAEHYWLFTAAHVVHSDFPIFLLGEPFFPILAEPLRICEDPLDLAYAQLAPDKAATLQAAGLSFLPIENVDPSNGSFFPGQCVFSGYRCETVAIDNERRSFSAPATYLTSSFLSDDELLHRHYSPKIHLAARVNHLRDSTGAPLSGFDPVGLSGGALWRVTSPNEVKLVGIVTEFDPAQKVISGTRIRPILAEIIRRSSM